MTGSRTNTAASREFEEAVYQQVAQEIASGVRRDGLWAKAIAESGGVLEAAKARYIQLRAQSLMDELEAQRREAEAQRRALHEARASIDRELLAAKRASASAEARRRATNAAGKLLFGIINVVMAIGLIGAIIGVADGAWHMLITGLIYALILRWSLRKYREGVR